MVLGLRSSKNKKGNSVHLDCTIQVLDIKPWPPSQALKSLRSVVLQWQNGDHNSGMTSPVAPSVGSTVAEGKIEFNASFKLKVNLTKEASKKGNDNVSFHKNTLEFNLYEPRRDKSKGQHLGHAVIDLAEHAFITEAVTVSVPVSSKRNYRNTAQPLLYVKIQPSDEETESSSSKEISMDKDGKESVSTLMSEEYAEEAEIASFTDDEFISHSSGEVNAEFSVQSSPEERYKEVSEEWKGVDQDETEENSLASEPRTADVMRAVKSESTFSDFPDEDILFIDAEDSLNQNEEITDQESAHNEGNDVIDDHNSMMQAQVFATVTESQESRSEDQTNDNDGENDTNSKADVANEPTNAQFTVKFTVNENNSADSRQTTDGTSVSQQDGFEQTGNKASVDLSRSRRKSIGEKRSTTFSSERFEKLKLSVRSPLHLQGGSTKSLDLDRDFTDISIQENVHDNKISSSDKETTNNLERASSSAGKMRYFPRANRSAFSNDRIRDLEQRIKLLEGELREAAAIELGLYAIVAVHGSSTHKVHTPARRLSRLYHHASKEWPVERRATAAKSIVSGLTLAAKACSTDVSRLTFWLSNTVVLRVIISETSGPDSAGNGSTALSNCKNSPLKWESISRNNEKFSLSEESEEFEDWEDPQTFISALEKIESWLFTRIVESVWWQILTPFMQSTPEDIERKVGLNSDNSYQRALSMGAQQPASLSIDIWQEAFREASLKLCPIRTAGHECGCLPMLAKMVMNQCVARLDVSMFNAILRDSDCQASVNPVSDPITNLKVLPTMPGEFSFGVGAQLKNAIGYWTKCLSELFSNEIVEDDGKDPNGPTSKPFPLLDALSDLLILPKDMLFDESIRKEVCPKFSASLIKQILAHFVPDELCPDSLPPSLLEELDGQKPDIRTEEIRNIPCSMFPINYSPPSVGSVESFIGDVRNPSRFLRTGSALIRKCHTSDDELDELDTPLASIMMDRSPTPRKAAGANDFGSITAIRYQLLREVWKDDE